jgi:lysyl endopeptidase
MKSIFFTFITLCSLYVSAQVTTTTYTAAEARTVRPFISKTIINEYRLTAPDITSLQRIEQEEETREGDKGFKFAHAIDVSINPLKYGKWSVDGAFTSWTTRFIAPGATCLSINFSKFNLPANTEIYISNNDRTMVTGPITSSENNAAGVWGSSVYKGNTLIVEIKVPVKLKDRLMLETQSIAYGYKEIFREKDFGDAGGCNINVLCPLGNGWAGERNAVSVVLNASSTRFCSGSLVANTCNTDIPYYLTADHCFSDGNFANWKFLFQYWSPQCTPNQNGSTSVLYNGSQLRANNATSDFRLLQLNQTPPSNSGLHYAGWSRNTAFITTLTGIHHPSGDVMKISQVNASPFKSAYGGGTGTDHWQMDWGNIANGVTEGGSSGSPLFDQNHRIIGQLHGGYSSCSSGDLRDWYGAFDVSWTGGGTNATRLSNWLDPNNSGATTINTANVSTLFATTTSLAISGDNAICTGSKTYTLSNIPAGSTVQWGPANGYVTITPSGNDIIVTVNPGSTGFVTLTASTVAPNGCTTSNVASKVISVGGPYAGFNIVVHPAWPTNCWEAWAFNYFQAQLAFGSGYTSYEWGHTYLGVDYPGPETGDTYTFIPYDVGTYEIYVRPKNSCGVGPKSTRIVEVTWSCIGFRVQVSPNPAKGTLYVTIAGEDQKTAKQQPAVTQLTLREVISARIVKQWTVAGNQKQLSLNLTGIKKGNYMLTVQQGINKQSKQIIVE